MATTIISACSPMTSCPTCCSVTQTKRTTEKVPAIISWAHRPEIRLGGWVLRSVVHTIVSSTGASLTYPAYDATRAYALGVSVAIGTAVYTSTGAVLAGQDPVANPGLWTLQVVTNPDLRVSLDTDSVAEQWIDKDNYLTAALVEGGVSDTDYRIQSLATFRDCEGRLMSLWDCVLMKVLDCS